MIDLKLLENPTILKQFKKKTNFLDFDLNQLIIFFKKYKIFLKNTETIAFLQNKKNKSKPTPDAFEKILNQKKILSESKKFVVLLQNFLETKLLLIPNIPDNSVPDGINEKSNKIIYMSPHQRKKTNLTHLEIGKKLDFIKMDLASTITGAKFAVYKGDGASLIRFLKNFCLNFHLKNKYQEWIVPNLVNQQSLIGTGQFPKLKNDTYQLNNQNLFLSPTSEVQLINLFAKKIIAETELPKKITTYTNCYRKEAGAASAKTPGILRLHQFQKVEVAWITKPETSFQDLEIILKEIKMLLEQFEIPYRVALLSAGELGHASAKTYDIEVWMPSQQNYVEISSISNTTDFQARRINIKIKNNKKTRLAHTLNGSGLPLDRLFAVILETHYNQSKNKLDLPKIFE